MDQEWTHIRVRRSTHAALAQMIDRLTSAADAGQMERWWEGDLGPSFDALIARLLRADGRHHERVSLAKQRARERRREELLRAVFDVASRED